MTTITFDNLTVSLGGVTPVRALTAELPGRISGIIGAQWRREDDSAERRQRFRAPSLG